MQLYADEDFFMPIVRELRKLGHDVLTVSEDGRKGLPDEQILERASSLARIVLTHNRDDFESLHRSGQDHVGILSATQDLDSRAVAMRIDAALNGVELGRWHSRVNRPSGRKRRTPPTP